MEQPGSNPNSASHDWAASDAAQWQAQMLAMRWYERAAVVVFGIILIALLAVSVWLNPDPQGMGTHQQLGLPPCSSRQLFGFRCPACGMTTSWAHFMNGNLWGAMQANMGGTLLALVALPLGPWLLASGVRGKWLFGYPPEMACILLAIAISIVTLSDWSFRLYFYGG